MIELLGALWRPALEISLLWLMIYGLLLFLRDTRGVQVLTGLLLVGVLFVVTQRIGLQTIEWLVTKIFAISLIALLIIFQPELRRLLAGLGQHPVIRRWAYQTKELEEFVGALETLSKTRHGALIALERTNSLKPYTESGVLVDGRLTRELICTLFMPNAPLHDGGLIISGDRLVAAGCVFPLSQNTRLARAMGTRHRAAVGLSEETDAVVLVVSEETGAISLAVGGRISRNLDAATLARTIGAFYQPIRAKWPIMAPQEKA